MQPLGLGNRLDDYHALLQGSHDFRMSFDVLRMDESHAGDLSPQFIDGQVNIQRDATVKRTATFQFFDPERSLHLDTDSPFAGALFADRMIRVTHTVTLPGFGSVKAVPFVGPIVRVGREGDVLTVECQDKTLLSIEGSKPKRVKKGHNAVDAIREIMRDCTGERRFRFPAGHKARLSRSYTVGWTSEASPWAVCQRIAAQLNMQLVYACDGALLLRRRPTQAAIKVAEGGMLTTPIRAQYDVTTVRNYVRVTGDKKKRIATTKTPQGKQKYKSKTIEFTEDADLRREHPLSPRSLGRNGVPRYLPLLIDDSSIKKESKARRRAEQELDANLPMSVTASFSGVPVFHLDYGDIVRAVGEDGSIRLPFIEGSIPLGLGGDMTFGAQRRVSKPRRR